MAKSYKHNQDSGKRIRNLVAFGMIAANTGKSSFMRDRRERRPKDARRNWKNEEYT